eukprot:6514-Heterococcus_DN1.PRE.1
MPSTSIMLTEVPKKRGERVNVRDGSSVEAGRKQARDTKANMSQLLMQSDVLLPNLDCKLSTSKKAVCSPLPRAVATWHCAQCAHNSAVRCAPQINIVVNVTSLYIYWCQNVISLHVLVQAPSADMAYSTSEMS